MEEFLDMKLFGGKKNQIKSCIGAVVVFGLEAHLLAGNV